MSGCCPSNSVPYVAPPPEYKDQGEWVVLANTLNTYITGPHDATSALIVIHDAFGVNAGRQRVLCDAWAQNGWKVCLPDLFDGNPPLKADNTVDIDRLVTFVWSNVGPRIEDILLPHLKSLGIQKVGAVGFCYGAYVVGHLSTTGRLVAGASPHPSLYNICLRSGENNAREIVARCKNPIMLLTAGNDRVEEKPGGEVEDVLSKKEFGKECYFREYPDMMHGWFSRGDQKNEKIARDVESAFSELQTFFQRYLK